MSTPPTATKRHDIVIVGAGPSAMGLVFGLLSPFDRRFNTKKQRNNTTSSTAPTLQKNPTFDIAIIERGPFSFLETKPSISRTKNEAKKDPSLWFQTSHDETSSRDLMLLQTVPQRGMNGRMLHVPIGGGLGGGSNINACLAVPPTMDDFDSWPEQWTRLVTVTEDGDSNNNNNNNGSGNGGHHSNSSSKLPRIMASVKHIECTLVENNALYTPSDDTFSVISQSQNGRQATCPNKRYCTKNKLNHSEFIHVCLPRDENFLNQDYPFNIHKMSFTARKNVKDDHDDCHSAFLRVNYYQGLLEPLLKANPHLKKYITFYTYTEAQRLIIEPSNENDNQNIKYHTTEKSDPWVAKGVQCISRDVNDDSNTNTLLYIMANKKVILCTGAILSPILLMMSGIGAKAELLKAGIEPLVGGDSTQWTGVGKNLQDHLVMVLGYTTIAKVFPEKTVNALRGYIRTDIISNGKDDDDVQDSSKGVTGNIKTRVMFNIMDGTKFHTMAPSFAAFFFLRKVQMKNQIISRICNQILHLVFVGIRWTLTILMRIYPLGTFLDTISAQILIGFMNLKSRGEIRIAKRANTVFYDHYQSIFDQMDIIIHPDYLSDERDIVHIQDAWQVLRQFVVPNLFNHNMMEIFPRNLFKTPISFARNSSFPFYHWMGTCSIETTDTDNTHYVVDKNLKVRNIHSLYVCDASIIPSSGLSVPPSLTLAALGYTAASIIDVEMDQYKAKKA